MLVCLLSAKGSPGVTTTTLCLAASAGPKGLAVELDPSGGDLECWTKPHGEPGLIGLAARQRLTLGRDDLSTEAVEVVDGVPAITAPTTEPAASAVLARIGDRLDGSLRAAGLDVFVDLGRWFSTRSSGVVGAADMVLVVCRPTLASIEHTRGLLTAGGPLDSAGASIGLVVVGGTQPYGPDAIKAALGCRVAGVLPWDPTGLIALVDRGVGRAWHRSVLSVAAGDLVAQVRWMARAAAGV
jgi:MinD-like ATPase involved in chromosome partitioning or flagellar assembly